MAQFVNSKEMVSSGFDLWNDKRTQFAVEDTYDVKIWPITNIKNETGPINFVVKPQNKGLLTNIDVVSKLRILHDGNVINSMQKKLSVVNNFANSLWSLVSITMDDRTELMQSMKNAYAYSSFFSNALNTQSDHGDYLFYNEMFKMDTGVKSILKDGHEFKKPASVKSIVDSLLASYEASLITLNAQQPTGEAKRVLSNQKQSLIEGIGSLKSEKLKSDDHYFDTNDGALHRAMRINKGQSVTLSAKLQCPLINTAKFLPSKIGFRISLTQNSDDFLLYTSESGYSIELEDVYLLATYHQPRERVLKWMNEELIKAPAKYYISNPEIIIKPIQNPGRVIRVTDIFHKIPEFAFFCLQNSLDYEGYRKSNPYAFIKYKKFQFYKDGSPLFVNELNLSMSDNGDVTDYGEYLRQLYETVGKDLKGNCLIDSANFPLHFMTGVSFTADRSNTMVNYMNLQDTANTHLKIDMGINEPPQDMILIVYAIYNRKIEIDSSRNIKIIE